MKSYILLTGDDYYPNRWDDYRGVFESIDKALLQVVKSDADNWYQVIDLTTMKVVVDSDWNDDFIYCWVEKTKIDALLKDVYEPKDLTIEAFKKLQVI